MEQPISHLTFNDATCARLHSLGFDPETFREEVQNRQTDVLSDHPSLYCGTYRKYNEGSLDGMWIDLTRLDDYDEFITFCLALHADESDPELMFQDYEYFPRTWYNESGLDRETFDNIRTYYELSALYPEVALSAWVENYGKIDQFEDNYMGAWDSEEDFAEYIIDECFPDAVSDFARPYFDFKAYAETSLSVITPTTTAMFSATANLYPNALRGGSNKTNNSLSKSQKNDNNHSTSITDSVRRNETQVP